MHAREQPKIQGSSEVAKCRQVERERERERERRISREVLMGGEEAWVSIYIRDS